MVPGFSLSGGNLYNTAGSQQQLIDTGVLDFTVVNNKVYDLHTSGILDSMNADGSAKAQLDTGVESFAVTPQSVVYELNQMQGGVLEQSVTGQPGTFQQIAQGTTTQFAMAPNGTAYALGTDGVLRYNGGAAGGNCYNISVNGGVESFEVAPSGRVYALTTGGLLMYSDRGYAPYFSTSANGIASFEIAPSGRVYALTTGGLLMYSDVGYGPYFNTSDSGVESFTITPTGVVYELNQMQGGVLLQSVTGAPGTFQQIGPGNTTAFAMPPNGTAYALGADGVLRCNQGAAGGNCNQQLDKSVMSFQVLASGDWLALQGDGKALVDGQSAYSAGARIIQIVSLTGGLLTLFDTGAVYFDTDPRHLGGGGAGSGLAYSGTLKVLQIVPVAGGLLTRFDTGAVYFDTDPRHLGGAGAGSGLAYTGTAKIQQIVPVAGGLLTRFDTGAVYFDTDPRHLGGGGAGSASVYNGTAKVVQIVPVVGGLLTLFNTGSVYFDTDPRHLGGGGVGSALAYNSTATVVQILPAAGGVLTRFNTGSVYFDTDPRHLGGVGAGSMQFGLSNLSVTQWTSGQPWPTLGTINFTGDVGYGNLSVNGLPLGLQWSLSGNTITISGTPSQTGPFNVVTSWTVAGSTWLSSTSSLTMNPPVTLSSTALPVGTSGSAYSATITASGGTGYRSVAYTVTSGAIPTGLSFARSNGTLTVSGTPTAPGSVSFNVTATDSTGSLATASYTLSINAPQPVSATYTWTATVWIIQRATDVLDTWHDIYPVQVTGTVTATSMAGALAQISISSVDQQLKTKAEAWLNSYKPPYGTDTQIDSQFTITIQDPSGYSTTTGPYTL
jgi:hypothetical protein